MIKQYNKNFDFGIFVDGFEREMAPLKAIRDNYPKTVITPDPYTTGNYEGIHVINAIGWLLVGSMLIQT